MLLSEITEDLVGQKVSVDIKFGTFVGVVAWVEKEEFLRFNNEKYLHEPFGRNVSAVHLPYEGQKDYYLRITTIEVGFYGDTSKRVEIKEEYDIAAENQKLEDYLRKYNK